jgi:hypothetical protein
LAGAAFSLPFCSFGFYANLCLRRALSVANSIFTYVKIASILMLSIFKIVSFLFADNQEPYPASSKIGKPADQNHERRLLLNRTTLTQRRKL